MRTDYQDYIPSTAQKKYQMTNNSDGTVSFTDVTNYTQEGDKLSAGILNELSHNAVWPLTHQGTQSGAQRLTGLNGATGVIACQFKAVGNYSASFPNFIIDGVTYTPRLTNGESPDSDLFVSGVVVPCVVDTNSRIINFKSGGGVSSAKLALADAEEGDVASGKTFYAGDKSLKTGTFVGYQYITGTVDVPVRISSERAYLYPPFSPKIFIGKVLSGGHDGGGIVNMQAPFSFKLSYQRGDWQSGEDAYSVVFYSDGSIGVSVVYDGSAEEANMQYIILG